MDDFAIAPISLTRFNALGGYARHPRTFLMIEELEFFETRNGDVLGIATLEITDQDFGGIVLARDSKRRFRCVDVTEFVRPRRKHGRCYSREWSRLPRPMRKTIIRATKKRAPVDFFTHLHEQERLNPAFVELTTNEAYSPAREIIEPMMRWYEDADGNFVEQFQTTGFDQRIWELYLFAMLIEANYSLSRENAVPDFCCSRLRTH